MHDGLKALDGRGPASETFHSLLLQFVSLGRQANQIRADLNPAAASDFRKIQQQARLLLSEARHLSALLQASDEHRMLFSAAILIASAAVKNSRFERELMDLWNQL